VIEVCGIDDVSMICAKRPYDRTGRSVDDNEVAADQQSAIVQLCMVVRTQAQDVARHVWAFVGSTQGPDVGAFGVQAVAVDL